MQHFGMSAKKRNWTFLIILRKIKINLSVNLKKMEILWSQTGIKNVQFETQPRKTC